MFSFLCDIMSWCYVFPPLISKEQSVLPSLLSSRFEGRPSLRVGPDVVTPPQHFLWSYRLKRATENICFHE